MTLAQLNSAASAEAAAALGRCCGASRWVAAMLAARPFTDRAALHATADAVSVTLQTADWREAFEHHPRIGDVSALREKFAATASWAAREQSGADPSDEQSLRALADGNRAYETRFGHIFIVCATGLTAPELLERLNERIHNAPESELGIAACEQMKITHLRLDKLLEDQA